MGDKNHCQFQLPDCWNDDVRMTALFATPRSESINPHDWAGKLKFWKELILNWAIDNNQLIISIDILNEAFCRKGKYPASLSRVLEEMNRQGDISTREVHLCDDTNSSWAYWGLSLVKTSVSWSWRKVISSLTEIEKGAINYVVPKVLEERSEHVLELPEATSENVVDLEELKDRYPEMFSNEEETHMVLYNLQKKGKIVVDISTPRTMIKFLPSNNSVNKTPITKKMTTPTTCKEKPSAEITEVDRSLVTLKRTEVLLENEIEDLENQIHTLEQIARTRLKEGARGAAKAALYRRKQLQAIVDKRNQALINIQSMKLQLSQAKTDYKVMEAYKIGLSALKKSFDDLPLNEDNVQDTLIELESVFEQHRDIENALSQTIISADDATESDLEEELMNILLEAPKLASDEEPELVLPSAPSDSPKAEAESSMTRQFCLPALR